MHNLMMDLLDLGQTENNSFKLNKSFVSLIDLIDRAIVIVQHHADSKGVKFVRQDIQDQHIIYY